MVHWVGLLCQYLPLPKSYQSALEWYDENSRAVAVTVFGCFLAVLLFGAELKQHLVPQLEQTVCTFCLFLTVIRDCLNGSSMKVYR